MTLRISTGLRNLLNDGGSLKKAFKGGKIHIYSGSQPSSADAAPTGTLLCTITAASGSHTDEVQATGSVTLTGGASGSVDSIKVGMPSAASGEIELLAAAVAYDTDLSTTAANVAAAINEDANFAGFRASSSGAVITITAPRGAGAAVNNWTVVSTTTTLTKTDANLSGGVTAVNGLDFETAASGALAKETTQVWSGVAVAGGTAGWFRMVGGVADGGDLDSDASDVRLDGAISTSGAQLNMTSVSIAASSTQTISSFTVNVPAS